MKYFRSPKLYAVPKYPEYTYVEAQSIQDAQSQNVDLIDISYEDFCQIQNQFEVNSLDSHYLGSADCLIRFGDRYQFYQLSQKAFLSLLSNVEIFLKTDDYAVIVGDELSISQFLPALAKLGYSRFVFVVEDPEAIQKFIQNIQKTLLNIKLLILGFNQVSSIDCISSLLLVDINHKERPELVESLTYFNFLTTGSAFFDVRSALSDDLVQEALRAQMVVIDSAQYAQVRLEIADQILTKKIK